MEIYMLIVYGLMAGWTVFSIYYILRIWIIKDTNRIIPYIYDSIPTVFTTLGILGTFVGIYFGLQKFDVNQITDSIPALLEGMKTAFSTSIWGISLSLLFGKISQIVLRSVEMKVPPKSMDELIALQEVSVILREIKEQNYSNFKLLNRSLVGDIEESLSTQIIKLRNQFNGLDSKYEKQCQTLEKVQQALGGDSETSLLIQIQKLRTEQNDYSKAYKYNADRIIDLMNINHGLLINKFAEFSELLAKNNTETLVEVMRHATEEFNTQMSALIERLVQENFQELNNSVQKMNQWQQENKETMQKLTNQFIMVSTEFAITANAVKEITENTTKLTNENSHLTKLIQELQKVMIDDSKFQDIIGKLVSTIDTLKANTIAFDDTTNKLNNWVRNQMNFNESVAKLLARLEEIEKIKDINEVFWANTKKQLNEGVALVEKASKNLSEDIETINAEFHDRLNSTLQNLDLLIQRIIQKYN